MKEFLKKLIDSKKAELEKLNERNTNATTVDEVRSIGTQILAVKDEIRNAEEKLAELEKEEENAIENRSFNPVAKFAKEEVRENEDKTATMEYRTAFMNYATKGIMSDVLKSEKRDNDRGMATDLGVLIPSTVIQQIITGVEKVYGQLYSRVKKTNLKGGVKYPIGNFSATFHRITETTKSDRQNAGEITGSVDFTYKIGEIRIAKTLLQEVLSVPVFEAELAKTIVEAYVKAMDIEIMTGNPTLNQFEGIITEMNKGVSSRIPATNIIEFTEDDMADWESWQKKLFAVIPLSMRRLRPEFVMTANTYEANIKTLKDNNNRPVYNETFNPVDGAETATFKGREVVFVEDDIVKNFDDAEDGDVFGMYWIPSMAYGINTNLEFYIRRYFDEEANEYVDKAIVINDGKILDAKYLYILKKKVEA